MLDFLKRLFKKKEEQAQPTGTPIINLEKTEVVPKVEEKVEPTKFIGFPTAEPAEKKVEKETPTKVIPIKSTKTKKPAANKPVAKKPAAKKPTKKKV